MLAHYKKDRESKIVNKMADKQSITNEKKNMLIKYAKEQIAAKKQYKYIPTINKTCNNQPRSKS